MKKIGPTLLGIIIGALGTYFGVPNLTNTTPNTPVETVLEDKGKPMDTITIAKAIKLSNNWTVFRKPAVDSCAQAHGQKVDDRSVTWDLKGLQRYLRYAKRESKKLGYEMTGICVHLGVYGPHEVPECRNLTTMFIEPIGHEVISKASTLNFGMSGRTGIPLPPYNNGEGGDNEYSRY